MPMFEYSFEKFTNNLSSPETHVKNIEVKLVQKIEDFHTLYGIDLENKKFSEKSRDFQRNSAIFRVFHTNFLIFSRFKGNA